MEENNRPVEPEQPVQPAPAEQDGGQLIQALARELARELADKKPAREEPHEPTAEEIQAEKVQARRRARRRRLRALRSLILRAALLAVVVYVLFFHLVGLTLMPSGDMYPRIDAGDLVLFYRLDKDIRAQDIIVFEKPVSALELPEGESAPEAGEPADQPLPESGEEGWLGTVKGWYWTARRWLGFKDPGAEETRLFICRVVAAGGDSVEIGEGGRLIVNGNTMIESNIFYSTPEYTGFLEYPVTLGQGEYFVLADMRSGGADSRFFGPVRQDEILGTVITIVRRNNL